MAYYMSKVDKELRAFRIFMGVVVALAVALVVAMIYVLLMVGSWLSKQPEPKLGQTTDSAYIAVLTADVDGESAP